MCVSKNVFSRLHQIEEVNKFRGKSSMNVRHFGRHVEGLGAKNRNGVKLK